MPSTEQLCTTGCYNMFAIFLKNLPKQKKKEIITIQNPNKQ